MKTKTASQFLWHDLDSAEPERVLAFYGDVLGWRAEPFEGGPMRYWVWQHEGAPAGGIGELTEDAKRHGARPGWNGYIESGDVDADAQRVVKLGGRVRMAPVTLDGVGRMAVVEDPQGAAFTLFTPAPMEAPMPGTPLVRFAWHDLATSDPGAAWAFYAEMFGWQESRRLPMGDMGDYRIFAADGVELGGMIRCGQGTAAHPGWLYYVQVPDIEGAVRRVQAGGGDVVVGIVPVPGGRIAVCRDPEGADFGLYEQATTGGSAQ